MTTTRLLTLLNNYLKDGNYCELNELKLGLEENIRTEINKSSSKPNLARAMNDIIKAAKKDNIRPALMGGFLNEDWLTVCDGYRAIQTHEPVSLEMVRDDLTPLNVTSMIGYESDYHKTLNLPTIQMIKAHITMQKAANEKPMIVLTGENGDEIAFNPAYLLNMLTAITLTEAKYNTINGPVLFEQEQTRGVLLPIRRKA